MGTVWWEVMDARVMVVFLILVEDGECGVVECDGCNPFNDVPALS